MFNKVLVRYKYQYDISINTETAMVTRGHRTNYSRACPSLLREELVRTPSQLVVRTLWQSASNLGHQNTFGVPHW